jgi:hypothetical protein
MSQPPLLQSRPEQIDASEVERLIALAEQGQLDAADQRRIAPLLRTLVWLQHTLLETRISLAKLKRLLFGKPTEKTRPKPRPDPPPDPPPDSPSDPPNDPPGAAVGGDAEAQADNAAPSDSAAKTTTATSAVDPGTAGQPDKPPPLGHGRFGAADYPGAEVQCCAHDDLVPGARCPACERGKLYALEPLVRLRFSGQPLVAVTRYDIERLRCSACGALFVAHLPPGVGAERDDTRL